MRSPGRSVGRTEADDLAMTSMIDVVFLLLVFFVWTSSFDLPETNLPGRIAMTTPPAEISDAVKPSGNLPPPLRYNEIIVRILAGDSTKNRYRVGAIELNSTAEVRERLVRVESVDADAIVIVDPDGEVRVADAIEIFDIARDVGFSRVMLAVDPPE